MNTKNLFLYKNEQLILVEENLSYFNVKTDTKNSLDQFSLIHVTNISDIVHLVKKSLNDIYLFSNSYSKMFKYLYKKNYRGCSKNLKQN